MTTPHRSREPLDGLSAGRPVRVPDPRSPELDVLGIGFGPSNLSLAIALGEHNHKVDGQAALQARFFEKQPRFGWHRGMLIDDATMQVTFLKDLVTMRNPSSDFSFLSYLHQKDRLADFINHKIFFPLRIEFHDYLEWAAKRVDDLVEYGSEVINVRPVTCDDVVTCFEVVIRRAHAPDEPIVRRARNIVVAVGLEPSLPPGVALSSRIWHNLDLMDRVAALPDSPSPRRFIVVGAGQSAAEATEYLHRRFPDAEVCSLFSRYGYTPTDDTPFVNRIFDPEAVDVYFGAPRDVKRRLFDCHRNTTYSVVDAELIAELYRRVYQEKVQGRQRLRILNASRLMRVDTTAEGVEVAIEHLPTGERTASAADALVYATGYQQVEVMRLLGEAGQLCLRDEEGMVCVERDYRIAASAPAQGGIYLHGGTEHSHGLTSTTLSCIAVRSGEILQSILDAVGDRPRSWSESSPDLAGTVTRELTSGLDPAVRVAGPPPVPELSPPWALRVVKPRGADLNRVHRWMNEPHVAAVWDRAWPKDRWSAEVARQLAGVYARPYLIDYDGEPLAYVEVYRAARDVVAAYYPAGPHDLGLHIAIGDVARTGRGLGTAMLRAVVEGLLAAEQACTRIVADPDSGNEVGRRTFAAAGFQLISEVDLPHKRAALCVRPRAGCELPQVQSMTGS